MFNDVYDIPADIPAAEKCSHASLMTYYNDIHRDMAFEAAEKCSHAVTYYDDIHRDMAAIFSCVNGCVFHS